MGREKCEKYPKNKRNLLLLGGGGGGGGGGGNSKLRVPPKGPEKNTV